MIWNFKTSFFSYIAKRFFTNFHQFPPNLAKFDQSEKWTLLKTSTATTWIQYLSDLNDLTTCFHPLKYQKVIELECTGRSFAFQCDFPVGFRLSTAMDATWRHKRDARISFLNGFLLIANFASISNVYLAIHCRWLEAFSQCNANSGRPHLIPSNFNSISFQSSKAIPHYSMNLIKKIPNSNKFNIISSWLNIIWQPWQSNRSFMNVIWQRRLWKMHNSFSRIMEHCWFKYDESISYSFVT